MTPGLAIPAATTAILAYLNARWQISHDLGLFPVYANIAYLSKKRQAQDRFNSFYILEEHALDKSKANKVFLIFEDQKWTFARFYDTVLRYAGWLQTKHQISPNEVVAIDFVNGPQFLLLVLAIWSLGATAALINYNLIGDPLIHSVKTSAARVLIVDPDLEHTVLTDKTKVAFASSTFRNDAFPLEIIVLSQNLQSSVENFPAYRAPDSTRNSTGYGQVAVLISTSGTTGLPKQTIMPWGRYFAGGLGVATWLGLNPVTSRTPDRYYTCMPLYHSSAFMAAFHACLITGTTLVLGRRFSASNFWSEVIRHEATIVHYVGETLRYLVNTPIQPGEETDHKVRLAFGNGLRPDVWKKFKTRFGIETIAEFYGASEGVAASFNMNRNDFSDGAIGQGGIIKELLVSKSQAIVKVDWEIEKPWRDPKTGFCVKVPRGSPGELLFKLTKGDAAKTFYGYLNESKASEAKVLHDVFVRGDAYFRSGDVVRWDPEGRLWFSDRIGDTFRWKSENVSTTEVGEILGYHSEVLESNVYGVQVPGHEGRAGCAAILLKESALIQDNDVLRVKPEILESLATYVTNSLPRYSTPVFLRVTRAMEITGNNKPQKTTFRSQGIDTHTISKAGSGDQLYWLKPGAESYTLFGPGDLQELKAGKARL